MKTPMAARPIAFCASLMIAACVGTGCSGVRATKSVSPLDFILPGLMRNEAPKAPLLEPGETMLCFLPWPMEEGVATCSSYS